MREASLFEIDGSYISMDAINHIEKALDVTQQKMAQEMASCGLDAHERGTVEYEQNKQLHVVLRLLLAGMNDNDSSIPYYEKEGKHA